MKGPFWRVEVSYGVVGDKPDKWRVARMLVSAPTLQKAASKAKQHLRRQTDTIKKTEVWSVRREYLSYVIE